MNRVTELDLPVFDYTEPEFSDTVYHERLAGLRRLGWLARSPLAYLVLEREPGEFFLRSRATAFPGRQIAEFFGITSGPLADHIDRNILNLTGDQHRRLRALAGPAFGPRAIDRWRPLMRQVLARLWPARAGVCEFVSAVAKPYAAQMIAAVLSASPHDARLLHQWSGWVQKQFDVRALETNLHDVETSVLHLTEYVTDLLERDGAATGGPPSGDLISELLAAGKGEGEAGGDRLSHAECVDLVVNLIAGGIDTVQSQLSLAIRLFAAHPAQWELLAVSPGLVPRAVNEVLRFEPAVPFTARICLQDIECRDVLFPAGTIVAVCAERANRQLAGGEEFDITAERDDPVLTFGAGPHYCLGASPARAELEEALAYLAPRSTGLALDEPAVPGGVEGIYPPTSPPPFHPLRSALSDTSK
jgi:cytochrome P450